MLIPITLLVLFNSASLGDASHAGSSHSRVYRQSTHSSQLANRSENHILFEVSLLATKSDLDEVFKHLIGRSVEVLDAFRLGRKPSLSSAAVDPSTPPPSSTFN